MGTPRACSRTRAVTFSVIARPIGDGDDVRAVDPLDVVGAELIEVAERPDARVVHQHVDPTVRGEHALHQHRALGGVGDVAGLDLDGGMLGGKGLQVAMQGLILWVPVEKLFMSEIGFTPASVGVMAAAYAAVVPLLEVPSGVLADRWSRNRIMVLAWKLLHDAVPSTIRAGVSSGAGTASWLLFLPLSLALGWLGRAHGVPQTGWILTGAAVLVGALLVVSTRLARPAPSEPDDAVPPADLACQELVELVTDLLDGVLPPGWRDSAEAHLRTATGAPSTCARSGPPSRPSAPCRPSTSRPTDRMHRRRCSQPVINQ